MNKKELGALGEEKAAVYYRKKGYKILERNFFLRGGEIDLVVEKSHEIIFVEVKTRASSLFGLPEESITYKKAQSLLWSINHYLSQGDYENYSWRADLVAINISNDGKVERFEVFENLKL